VICAQQSLASTLCICLLCTFFFTTSHLCAGLYVKLREHLRIAIYPPAGAALAIPALALLRRCQAAVGPALAVYAAGLAVAESQLLATEYPSYCVVFSSAGLAVSQADIQASI
jgi:hypothetical protein